MIICYCWGKISFNSLRDENNLSLTAFVAGITKINFTSLITSVTKIILIVSSSWNRAIISTVETIKLSYLREKQLSFSWKNMKLIDTIVLYNYRISSNKRCTFGYPHWNKLLPLITASALVSAAPLNMALIRIVTIFCYKINQNEHGLNMQTIK